MRFNGQFDVCLCNCQYQVLLAINPVSKNFCQQRKRAVRKRLLLTKFFIRRHKNALKSVINDDSTSTFCNFIFFLNQNNVWKHILLKIDAKLFYNKKTKNFFPFISYCSTHKRKLKQTRKTSSFLYIFLSFYISTQKDPPNTRQEQTKQGIMKNFFKKNKYTKIKLKETSRNAWKLKCVNKKKVFHDES